MSRKGKSTDTESRLVVAQGWKSRGAWGVTATGYGVSFAGGENVLKLTVVIAVQLWIYKKPRNHTLKVDNLYQRKLYLNKAVIEIVSQPTFLE